MVGSLSVQRVGIVTPEYYGRILAGGLGMAVHGLVHALHKKGIDVRVITAVDKNYHAADFWKEDVGTRQNFYKVSTSEDNGIPIYQIHGINLGAIYQYLDAWGSVHRAQASEAIIAARNFSAAAAQVIEKNPEGWLPDIIDLHEWHSAATAVDAKLNNKLSKIPVITNTHNASYIGPVPQYEPSPQIYYSKFVLPESQTALQVGSHLFKSLLEMGFHFSDGATTVSETYAKEILTGKAPVDQRLKEVMRKKGLEGILNGLNTELFDPKTDPHIVQYDASDAQSAGYGKAANKLSLHQKFGFKPQQGVLQLAMMGRLVDQKGIDLVEKVLDEIGRMQNIYLLIVGEPGYGNEYRFAQLANNAPENVRIHPKFAGPELQHLVHAGSDAVLMPSRYEPCGQVQMEAMRYGTLVIANPVGGLKETVKQFDGKSGNGILMRRLAPDEILRAVSDLHDLYKNQPAWIRAVMNAAREDFSWDGPRNSVGKHIAAYERAAKKRATAKKLR